MIASAAAVVPRTNYTCVFDDYSPTTTTTTYEMLHSSGCECLPDLISACDHSLTQPVQLIRSRRDTPRMVPMVVSLHGDGGQVQPTGRQRKRSDGIGSGSCCFFSSARLGCCWCTDCVLADNNDDDDDDDVTDWRRFPLAGTHI